MFNTNLPFIDLAIIALYFVLVLGVGFWARRRAAQSMESYFLGGKTMPWWMLGLSGSVSNFDITGTMWLISLIYVFGLKAFWVFWVYAFLISAFLMSYMARWIRRTRVMTAVELIRVRFGSGPGGKTARTASGVMQVTYLLFAVGYAFQGIGKFAAEYLPFTPFQCAVAIMGVTTLYVVVGGFRSVIITDVIQALILNVGGLVVAIIAFVHVDVALLHEKLDLSLLPVWHLPEAVGTKYPVYEAFGPCCIVWVLTGLFVSMGGAGGHYGEQRFLATRNTRDAAKAGAGWGLFLVFRWALVAGIVFMALSSLAGSDDPETVLPTILRDYIPAGLRGFILAGLIAAFMSTFSSTLNAAASILVRDLVQPFAPGLSERLLLRLSYGGTAAIVVVGLLIGTQAESIHKIWIWMTIGLNASVIIPNALRWYWWRMNGWGFAAGIISGMLLSIMVLFNRDMPEYIYGPAINAIALVMCVVVSLLTKPVDEKTLCSFFRQVRPKGFWAPVQRSADPEGKLPAHGLERTSRIVLNVILGSVVLLSVNLVPFYLIGHWYLYGFVCLAIITAGMVTLYFTWYAPLHRETEDDPS